MKPSLLVRALPMLAIAGVLAGGLAMQSLAQTGPSSPTAPHDQDMRGAAPMHHPVQAEPESVDHRITDLHAVLHISPAQEPQWRAFARVMRENATNMDREYRERAEQIVHMNALQDLESYAQLERTRAHDVDRLVSPFRHLYAVLSPRQKADADHLFRTYAEHHEHKPQTPSR